MVSITDHTYHMLSRHMTTDEQADFPLHPDPSQAMFAPQFLYETQSFNMNPDTSFYSRHQGYGISYTDIPQYHDPIDLRASASNYSTTSGVSASSSTIGSPHSIHDHVAPDPEWGLGLTPGIAGYDSFAQGNEYTFATSGTDEFALDIHPAKANGFVDPSILHPYSARPASQPHDAPYPPPRYPTSPASSHISKSPRPLNQDSQSPYLGADIATYPYPQPQRRPSLTSHQSYSSQDGNFSSEESMEKGRCKYPDCGKVFKDLKAHMLTHQNERPEKCPIQTCDYHVKGFARKYDKNRHTLTHYKGTMVCGFCPGSGSAAEKSFNRADVFKRHLTSVHAVEQTPPNSRKKTSGNINNGKKLSGYAPDATGKCSTCSQTFNNAQEFYEHLDDCVLRIVQQEEPSEAINAARLAEVEQDPTVHQTLRNNALPTTTINYSAENEIEEDDLDGENDTELSLRYTRKSGGTRNPANGVQKSRGLTHSKGGVILNTKGRKKRKDYPSSWGCPSSQMKMKKRVLCVFDGPRRLWKDDMMLDTDYEVRMKLSNEKAYVTDLDVQTMRRAHALQDATEEEKGPWITDDLSTIDVETFMEVKSEDC